MGGWKLPFVLMLALFIFVIYRNKSTIASGFKRFANSPAFAYSLSGFVVVFIFSRIFGKKIIWLNILQVEVLEGRFRTVKNAVEEGTELLGYGLILLGAIHYVIAKVNEKKHQEISTNRL